MPKGKGYKKNVIFEGPKTNALFSKRKAATAAATKASKKRIPQNISKSARKSDIKQRRRHKKMFGHHPRAF